MKLVATPGGVVVVDNDGLTIEDVCRHWYLMPEEDTRDGSRHVYCHINNDGAPLCGVELDIPHIGSTFKLGHPVCSACLRAEDAGGQLELAA